MRNQIDFIISQKKLKNVIQDSRSYHGTKTESDHSIVICKCNLVPYKIYKDKQDNTPKINVNSLKNQEECVKAQILYKLDSKTTFKCKK